MWFSDAYYHQKTIVFSAETHFVSEPVSFSDLSCTSTHHKTESTSNYSGHGYPDPNYLDNVLMELSLQGVTESDSDEDL